MVKRKGTVAALGEPPSKKRKKNVQKTEEVPPDMLATKPDSLNKASKSGIFPREHVGSRFCDSRVYIPTVNDFTADAEQGSMLDEVSLLPLEDLTSLMCGNTVYSLIKNTAIGADLTKCCAELQEKHVCLDLRAIANTTSVRGRSLRLLCHEGCSEEFLTPSTLSTFIEAMLLSVMGDSSWKLNVDEFSSRLSVRLVTAQSGTQLFDSTFYTYKIYQIDDISEKDLADIREQGKLTQREVNVLLECLLANILRFFVLYCVHGLRDQVVTKLSKAGEIMFQLKYPSEDYTAPTVIESDNTLNECIPLDDDYIPSLKDLEGNQLDDCSSLPYQVEHLPASQIVKLILGEEFYYPIQRSCPAFLAHLEEYASFLKKTQSIFQQRRRSAYFENLRRKKSEVLWMNEVDRVIFSIFTTIQDWSTKVTCLRRIIRINMRKLRPSDTEQKLWQPQDCNHKPSNIYYPLKRFPKLRQPFQKVLWKRISR
ncbi:hypothetical protein V3C99_003999 [Haemonchus contortus]